MDCKQLQMLRSVGPLLSVGVPMVNMSICGKNGCSGEMLDKLQPDIEVTDW